MPNMSMRTSIFSLLCSAALLACLPEPPEGNLGGPPIDAPPGVDPCMRKAAAGGTDGFPFDVPTFESAILPTLKTTCQSGSACHGPGNPNRFTVFTEGDCPDTQTFNEVFRTSSYQEGPAASPLVQAIDGTLILHPFQPPLTDALLAALTDFINAAKTNFEMGGGGGTPDAGADELTAE